MQKIIFFTVNKELLVGLFLCYDMQLTKFINCALESLFFFFPVPLQANNKCQLQLKA